MKNNQIFRQFLNVLFLEIVQIEYEYNSFIYFNDTHQFFNINKLWLHNIRQPRWLMSIFLYIFSDKADWNVICYR